MHTAFVPSLALSGIRDKVDSVLLNGNRIYLGHASGSLSIYTYEIEQRERRGEGGREGEDGGGGNWQSNEALAVRSEPLESIQSFSRRPIEQLAVIKEAQLLVSLTDGNIQLHPLDSLPDPKKSTSLSQHTKNQAHIFSITTNVRHDLSSSSYHSKNANVNAAASTVGVGVGGGGGGWGLGFGMGKSGTGKAGGTGNAGEGVDRVGGGGIPVTGNANANANAPTVVTTLAVGCKRRLVVFWWRDGEWLGSKELALPHQIRSLAFPTPSHLFLGFSTSEYGLVTLPSPDTFTQPLLLSDLFVPPTPIPTSVQPGGGGGGGGAGGGGGGGVGAGFGMAMKSGLSGLGGLAGLGGGNKVAKNLVIKAPGDGEVVIMRENMGIFLGPDGRPTRTTGIEYSGTPDEAVSCYPFILSLIAPPPNVSTIPVNLSSASTSTTSVTSATTTTASKQQSLLANIGTIDVPTPLVMIHSVIDVSRSSSTTTGTTSGSTSKNPALSSYTNQSNHNHISLPPSAIQLPEIKQCQILSSHSFNSPPSASTKLSASLLTPSTGNRSPLAIVTSSQIRDGAQGESKAAVTTTVAGAGGVTGTGAGAGVGEGWDVWLLSMRNWKDQIGELVGKGEYEEALSLLDGVENVLLPDKESQRKHILTLLAVSLFVQKRQYELSISLFIQLDINPAKVISLYPEKIAGKLWIGEDQPDAFEEVFGGRSRERVKEQREVLDAALAGVGVGGEGKEDAVSIALGNVVGGSGSGNVTPAGSWRRNLVMPTSPAAKRSAAAAVVGGKEDDTTSLKSKKSAGHLRQGSVDAMTAGGGGVGSDQAVAASKVEEAIKQRELRASIDSLVHYLTDRRQVIQKALSEIPTSKRPTPLSPIEPATAAQMFSLPDSPPSQLSVEQLHRVALIVETTLLKCYLAAGRNSMLSSFCRLNIWCEIEEVEGLLTQAKKYNELLDLYKTKSRHQKALQLLKRMSEDTDDVEEKVEPTIRYLQKLGSKHLDLIFEASAWVIELDREAGLEIFTGDLEEVESLPRHAVMSHLERCSREACMGYLEHIIHVLGEAGPEFHEKLAMLYFENVRVLGGRSEEDLSGTGEYRRLLEFLKASLQYRADKLLVRLPQDTMFEARAILLGRMGQHEGALQIYVHRLKMPDMAEEYCRLNYQTNPDPSGTIFLTLLRLYLHPAPPNKPSLTSAFDLIARNGTRIDASEVLNLLPPLVSILDLKVFLEKTIRQGNEVRNELRVEKQISRARMDQLERQMVLLERRKARITESRVCPQCHKRLGNSVIAVHSPIGEVTHYQCREAFLDVKMQADPYL